MPALGWIINLEFAGGPITEAAIAGVPTQPPFQRIPHPHSPTEVRQAFQQLKVQSDVLMIGASGQVLVGAGVGVAPVWGTLDISDSTNLTVSAPVTLTDDDISWAHLAIESLADPGVDRILFWDDGATATGWLQVSTGLSISGTVLTVKDGDIDHGLIGGLADDDHTQYLLADGTRALAGNLSLGSNDLTSVGLFGGVDVPEMNTFFNGTFQEQHNALVTSNGTVITMSLEKAGTGDLTLQFSDGYTTLDCTPAATIALTAGTDTSPQANYIYVLQSTKAITKSTSAWPSAEHAKIAYFLVPTAVFVQNNGCYVNQNWNDFLAGATPQGHMSHISKKVRHLGASWFSGVSANGATASYFTIGAGTTDWLSTSGVILQLHEHTFPAFNTSTGDVVLVVNQSGTPYDDIADLYSIVNDNTGAAIGNNKYFNLVFWGVINKGGEFAALMVNLPGGFYTRAADAAIDADGYDVYSIPREFSIDSSTGFLIARVTFQMGGTWTHTATVDLRGLTPATASGSSVNDHGGLGGLTDDDHPQYAIGTLTATNNNAGTIYKCYAVFADDNDDVDLTDASDEADSVAIGLVADTSIVAAATGDIRTSGILSATTGQWDTCGAGTGSGLVAGTKYYLGTAAGTLSPTRPTQPTQFTQVVGVGLSTTDMLVVVQKVNDVIEQITSDLTIYVSTAGSDTTGIGDSGSPLATLAGALSFLGPKLISSTATVTIQIADGTYTETSPTSISHANGDRIKITGENTYTPTINSIASSSGPTGARTVVLNMSSVSDIDVGDYILVPVSVSGGIRPETLAGCHEVTAVGGSTIDITSMSLYTSAPSGAVTSAIVVVKAILKYTGCHGLSFTAGSMLAGLAKCVIVGDGTASTYGIYLQSLNDCLVTGSTIGVSDFHTLVYIVFKSVFRGSSGHYSGGSTYGLYIVDGTCVGSVATISGCATGVYILQGAGVFQNGAQISGCTTGLNIDVNASVLMVNGFINYNPTLGTKASDNSLILGNGITYTTNGTDSSPAVNTLGNVESYIVN